MTTKRSNAIHSGRRCRRWAIKAPAHYYQTPRLPLYLTYTPPSMAFQFISGLVMSMRFPRVWWYPSQNEVCWEGWRSTIVLLIGLPPPRKRHQKQTLTHKFAPESEIFYNWSVSARDPILAQIDKFLQTPFAQLGALSKGWENFHFLKNFISDKIMHNMLAVISAKHNKHLY